MPDDDDDANDNDDNHSEESSKEEKMIQCNYRFLDAITSSSRIP